jgi:hypothetical protein
MIIDISREEFINKPIWCVYGPDCFPTLFCCKILKFRQKHITELVIWGYSIYEGKPGFRTLGATLNNWIEENKNRYESETLFFARQDEALAYLEKITKPIE